MSTILLTTPGLGNITIPAHSGTVTVECWGAGDNGSDASNPGATGHGGAYARSVLTLAAGSYAYYIGDSGDTGDTQFNNQISAQSGANGGSGGASSGNVANYAGGYAGTPGSDTGAGGGSSGTPLEDGAAGSDGGNGGGPGGNPGAGDGVAGVDYGYGGDGGDENADGLPGARPGGGGGSGGGTGVGGVGGAGQIRITYTPATITACQTPQAPLPCRHGTSHDLRADAAGARVTSEDAGLYHQAQKHDGCEDTARFDHRLG